MCVVMVGILASFSDFTVGGKGVWLLVLSLLTTCHSLTMSQAIPWEVHFTEPPKWLAFSIPHGVSHSMLLVLATKAKCCEPKVGQFIGA